MTTTFPRIRRDLRRMGVGMVQMSTKARCPRDCDSDRVLYGTDASAIQSAARYARGSRFEHGETPL